MSLAQAIATRDTMNAQLKRAGTLADLHALYVEWIGLGALDEDETNSYDVRVTLTPRHGKREPLVLLLSNDSERDDLPRKIASVEFMLLDEKGADYEAEDEIDEDTWQSILDEGGLSTVLLWARRGQNITACVEAAATGCDPEGFSDDDESRTEEIEDEILRLRAESERSRNALRALLDWCREHTSPTDANSPHALLIEAGAALGDDDAAQAPVYTWRMVASGSCIYVNAEGAEVGHVYQTPGGVWCADPWGRAKDHFDGRDAAKAHVEATFR